MMLREQILQLDNFKIDEVDIYRRLIFSKYEKIVFGLMYKIDKVITLLKQDYGTKNGAFIVHDINRGEHSEHSYHYIGMAIDGHFVNIPPYVVYVYASKAGFKGIGYYPDWKHPGWHFDIRNGKSISTWIANYIDGKQVYNYDIKYFIKTIQK